MLVITVIGARPQFIKAAVVSRALQLNAPGIQEVILHTGQHYDDNMSKIFFDELEIPHPEYNLEIASSRHGEMTGRMLEGIERVLLERKPDCVLVYGDTNSTLAGALAAAKLHLPVAHVEAGLRSFNRLMPEEINRVLTDHVADILFAPTELACGNLAAEGIPAERVILSGDVMYDAALYYREKAQQKYRLDDLVPGMRGDYILATLHRAENTDDESRLTNIVNAFVELARQHLPVVLPLHPRTRKQLQAMQLFDRLAASVRLIEPVGYLPMILLEANAAVVVTDSGGVQKEAYFHGVPCVTFRDETEWVELVESGWNRLAPPAIGPQAIVERILAQVGSQGDPGVKPYGQGDAALVIANRLLETGRGTP